VDLVTEEHRKLIGVAGPTLTGAPLSADELRRFVHASMEEDAIHWDEASAAARGYDTLVAPPLYPLHAIRRAPGPPDPLDRFRDDPDWDGASGRGFGGLPPVELPLGRTLNGGTEAKFFALARVGDAISSQSRYVSIEEREGRSGPMVVIVAETEYTNQDGVLLLRVRNTILRR
jgi:acyl dehydratase